MRAPVLWWRARQCIELALNLHTMRQNKNCDRSYIVGRRVGGDDDLDGNAWMQPGDRVVVRVKPVDKKLYARHTPRIFTDREWRELGEEQRLDHILGLTFDQHVYVGDAVAMASNIRRADPPPHDPDVRCQLCGRVGHTPRWCTAKDKPGFVQLKWRRMPHGIPRHRLRDATEDEYDDAFLDATGRMLVLLPEPKPRCPKPRSPKPRSPNPQPQADRAAQSQGSQPQASRSAQSQGSQPQADRAAQSQGRQWQGQKPGAQPTRVRARRRRGGAARAAPAPH